MISEELFLNQVNLKVDRKSLQYFTFKELIKNYNIKKSEEVIEHFPIIFRDIINSYNPLLTCNICGRIAWDIRGFKEHADNNHEQYTKCTILISKINRNN